MKLKTFTDILRGGNLALGSKISNLLTEDCTILEYTNDSVLFSKGSKLVVAKFKNPLTESRMTSSHVLDNEVIEISKRDLTDSMKATLNKVVECVISENLVDGQEYLNEFCQTYYQMSIIKNRYPEVFIEELKKKSKGLAVRKEAKDLIPAFKAELFSSSVITESNEEVAVAKLIGLIESDLGLVLALGKEKVKNIVADALLGNTFLAESVTDDLYVIAEDLSADSKVGTLRENSYDFGAGKFNDEDQEDVDSEESLGQESIDDSEESEIPSVPTEKESLKDDKKGEFEPFNPAMFSEDEIKQLHKTTLKSILGAMHEFVVEKGSDSADEQIDPELVDQIDADLAALDEDDNELGDDRLSEIEARWNPMISYFLDSDYHNKEIENDLSDQPLEDQLPPENQDESTDMNNIDSSAGAEAAPAAPAPTQGAPAPVPGM